MRSGWEKKNKRYFPIADFPIQLMRMSSFGRRRGRSTVRDMLI